MKNLKLLIIVLVLAVLAVPAFADGGGLASSAIESLLMTGGMAIVLIVLGIVAKKYLYPWVSANTERYARAKEIAKIADDITDALVSLYPEQSWTDWLDKAIDKIIKAAKLDSEDVAAVAMLAAIERNPRILKADPIAIAKVRKSYLKTA